MRMLAHLFGAAVVVVVGMAGPALADCYDILGCTDRDLSSKHFEYLAARAPTDQTVISSGLCAIVSCDSTDTASIQRGANPK